MDKIKSFDKDNLNQIRRLLKSAVKDLEDEMGILIDFGRINYSATEFTCTTTVGIKDPKASNARDLKWLQNVRKHGWKFNMTENMVGMNLTYQGKKYKILGCKDSKQNYPIVTRKEGSVQETYFPAMRLEEVRRGATIKGMLDE